MKFLLSTSNLGKLNEFKQILSPIGIQVVSTKDINLDMKFPEETGNTFEENAYIKANRAYELSGLPSIGDDSGLQVDALNGAPGIYSARYAGENASDKEKINKLLYELKDIPEEKRTARFVCAISCVISNEKNFFVKGICEGSIAFNPVGNNGFGYDPIFICKNGKTFSELKSDEKNKISHRGIAIRKLYLELNKIMSSKEIY